ncbi:PKD domain-containing protein [Thermoanaerobacterium sp. DL9XJH110]|uniref:PKD domain-containing protein n=1 Tax=Thermoanaerobacterium sp. DL9XJH110 TaxID=3386643 RepID=UPI003BB7BCBC
MPKKAITAILIVLMLVGIFPPSFVQQSRVYAATISDPKDINPPAGAKLTVGNSSDWYSAGFWKIYVDGKLTGDDLCVIDHQELSRTGNLWNMLHKNTINAWLDAFTPVPSPTGYYSGATFSKALESYNSGYIKTIIYNNKSSQRLHIRKLGDLAGVAGITYDEDKKEVYVRTTQFPTGGISFPSGVKEGDNITFQLRGTAYANIETKTIGYEFYIDGKKVASNTVSKTSFSDSVSKALTAGSHSLVLKVTDGVGRTTTYTKSITVQAGSSPPPPAGNINADLKMTLNPPKLQTGTKGDINVSLDATGCTSSGSGPFAYRWWVKLNGTYITPADGVNPGDGSPYYSTVAKNAKPGDVIWAKVKAYDYSINKYSEAETQKTVLEEGETPPDEPPPPPPVPPEPENKPPVARFTMPSRTGQGTTVDVKNRSYDPDGEIIDVEWDISPSTGADDSLGFDGGTITFSKTGTYEVTLTVTDDRGDSDSITKEIEVTNDPPEAVISAPDEVIQGDDVAIRSKSYDPDGEIASTEWNISPADGVMGTLEGDSSTIYFDKVGEYKITLTVEDEFGLSDTAEKTITVKPAVPRAFFDYTGTLKENRKIVLDASQSSSSERYPILWDRTEWQILPPAGGSTDDIKVVTSFDMQKRTVLFKKAGDYTVRVRVTNAANNTSEWYEKVLTIYPDLPPVADFYVYKTVLRNPDDGNYAGIQLFDISYSPDGDTINSRIWKYKYDSDNDGSFDDESWVILDGGNNLSPILKTKNVGKYLFELSVKEGFGEETIPEFISPSDYKTRDTSDKTINDKICEVINLRPVVDFEVLKKPKVDIVFTVGKADSSKTQNLNSKINSIIQTKLAAKNIDARIEAIETATTSTQTQDPSAIFSNWVSFYVGGSGTPPSNAWSYDSSLNAVVCSIGSRPAVGWYNPNAFSTKDLTVNYKLGIRNDATAFTHGEMGFMFRMKDVNNYYVYIIDNHSACGNVRYDQRSVLAKVVDGSFQVIKTGKSFPYFYRGQTWNVRIEVKGNNIKIYRDGGLDIEWTDTGSNYYSQGSYGFYVWDQPSAYYKDIQITTENIKTLDEALKTTTWRDNSVRFVVNISDIELPELSDSTKLANILSNMLSNGIYFIGLGTDTNKAQYQTFISRNDGKGAFYYNANMNTALNQTADYIISIIQAMPKTIDQYVLLGEQVTYNTYYSDPENDPKYTERWKYTHNPNYFENSLGLASFSGQYISGPVTVFDKVGKYDVIFQARDNPKNDIRFDNYRLWSYMPLNKLVLYVHRKPIAQYVVSMTPVNNIVTKTYQQQDIDFSGEGGHTAYWDPVFTAPSGEEIKTIEFKTAPAYDDRYEQQQVTGYKNGTWYVIKDYQDIHGNYSGAVSDVIDVTGQGFTQIQFYFVMHDSSDSASGSPDGSYYKITTTAGGITSYNVTLTSISYDLDHQSEPAKGIVQEEWKWKEATATSWNTGKPSTLALNKNYLVWLRVKDKEGAWSDPYVKTLSTMNENLPPVAQFTVNPSTQVIYKPITITDQSYDPNGDPIAEWKWRVKKPDGSWVNYGGTKPTNITSLGIGTYTIELTVRDNPRVGTPLWSEPYTQTVTVIPENNKPIARFTIGPNPIISDEPYNLNDTSYDPDGDPIVAREWKVQKPDGSWVTVNDWKSTFEEMGFDDGTYKIQLRVLDDPTKRHPALTPMWSDPYTVAVQVEGKLIVIGDSGKNVYAAGQALLLNARTEGKAFKVEAQMWYPHNEYTSTNVTTLKPDSALTDPPQNVMTWHSRMERGDRDIIVIIPMKTADGTYPVKFTAYKRKSDGSVKTAEDTIYVKVKGTIYDYSHSEIIGK